MATRLIAHRIKKEQQSKTTECYLRPAIYENTEAVEVLLGELRDALSKKSRAGKFEEQAGVKPPCQQRLETYLSQLSDAEFVAMSHDLTTLLEAKMQEQVMATGGFVVFAEHVYGEETFLLIALLSTESRTAFDAEMNLLTTPTLDFDHLRHGVRIRHSGVSSNTPGVLHFVAQKAEGVSDYFRVFLGCEKLPNTAEQGRLLIETLQTVAPQFGMDLDEANQKAHEYWADCNDQDRDMSLEGLANHLMPDNPKPLLKALGDEQYGLPGHFACPPASVMKNLIRFLFKGDGLKLEFNRGQWAGKVDIVKNVVQIKEPPASLIAKIRTELLNES